VSNLDDGDLTATTTNPNLHICGLTIVSQSKPNPTTWEYVLKGELSNSGTAVAGVNAQLSKVPAGVKVLDKAMVFGAVGPGDTAKTNDTITVRSNKAISPSTFRRGSGYQWTVVVQP
jgi:hypothetical protein